MPLARCRECMAARRKDDIHRTEDCPYSEIDQTGQQADLVNQSAHEAAVRLADKGASFDEILPFKLIEILASEMQRAVNRRSEG